MMVRALTILIILIPGVAQASIHTDGEFFVDQWEQSRFTTGVGNLVFNSEQRVTSSSYPPAISGAFRRTGQNFGTSLGTNTFRLSNIYTPFAFDPSLGALTQLSMEFDAFLISQAPPGSNAVNDTGGQYYGVSVLQAGNTFYSSGRNATYDQWVKLRFIGLTESDFTYAGRLPAGFPVPAVDFSTSGAPIQFGYYSYSAGYQSTSAYHAVDNWRLEVNPQVNSVPEPSSAIVFIGLMLSGAFVYRCRRKITAE